jgi:hypothetical protein
MAYSIVQTTGWNGSVTGGTGTTPVFPGNTTPGNMLLIVGIVDRWDASPTVDAAPTAARSGGETFTRIGFSIPNASGGASKQVHVFAAECTTAATTACSFTDTIGANSDVIGVCAVEVSGLADVSSVLLAIGVQYYNYPGAGDRNGPALGTLSAQPALLLSIGISTFGVQCLGNASANTLIAARESTLVLSHRRLTSTDSVSGSVNVSSDERVVIGGIALLEGSSGPAITTVSPSTFAPGASVTITGTGFGASQGTGSVRIGTSSSNPATGAVTQTVQSEGWSDTEIDITATRGALAYDTTYYLFVTTDGAASNAEGIPVSFISSDDVLLVPRRQLFVSRKIIQH